MTAYRRSALTRHISRLTFYAAAFAILVARPALAHDRTTSYSTWTIRGGQAHVIVRLSQFDLSRLPWMSANEADGTRTLLEYLRSHLQLLADDAPCALADGPRPLAAAPGRAAYEWSLRCPDARPLRIRSRLLLDVAPAHLHFARVEREGAPAVERVLSEREPTWLLTAAADTPHGAPVGTSLLDYLRLGIEHILSGYDHLTFLFALLLIGGSLGAVARVVTGFTVAHSITLALAVSGYVRPEPAAVEALIGLSIALVAAENLWVAGRQSRVVPPVIAGLLALLALAASTGHGRVPALTLAGLAMFSLCYFGLLRRAASAGSLRWGIAFIFGLVHGFGFASVLAEAGLSTARLLPALFGFNLGVEVGQLAFVAVAWPLLRLISRRAELPQLTLVSYGSAAVLTVGVFWFVTRTFG